MADGFLGDESLICSLKRHIGETVTIFTTSGGLSGSGFTGVLIAITPCTVKLMTHIAAPPECPLGSACTGPIGGYGFRGGYGRVPYGAGAGVGVGPSNWLGSVTEIPIDRIASFTHNAV